MSSILHLLRWGNILLILLTFLSYLSPYVSPEDFWPLSFFGLAYPWFLLFNVIFIISWLIAKKKYYLFSLGCIILGGNHFLSVVGLHGSGSSGDEAAFHIMSFNTHSMRAFYGRNSKQKPEKSWASIDDFYEMAKKNHAEILCFQEFKSDDEYVKTFQKEINESVDLEHVYFEKGISLAIFSKYPILKKDTLAFENKSNGCIYADIQIGKKVVRVYNVHLKSNEITGIAERVAKERNLQEKKTWLDMRSIMGKYKYNAQVRTKQARKIFDHILDSPHPVILCGDFNDTPQSYIYHMFTRNLQDSFKKRGRGLGVTYGGVIPALRIDYILTDLELNVLNHRILKEKYSDHYPIISEVSF